MESYEASRAIFTKIQSIDPQNASKIMGFILLNHGENDMKHLAFAPENILLSLITKAKTHLGLSSNTSCALLSNPISNPISFSRPDPLSVSGFDPAHSPNSPSIWSPNYVSSNPNNKNNILFDDFQFKDQNFSPFLDDPLNLDGKNVDFCDPSVDFTINSNSSNNRNFYHGKSLSFDENLPFYGSSNGGYYFNNNNNSNINDDDDINYDISFEKCQEEIIRAKIAQRHRLATQLIANGVNFPFNNKFNYLHSEAQRSAAALVMNDDFHKLNRARMARNELLGWDCNPCSRQIYLTFPADSTFKEEDVSDYFNKFGPVQDVRIPYQQKRMFGFVTFVFPETVKIILAKGNPHFVCDSRVLVKPYKEKGKLPDKRHLHHQFERGEFSCTSPSEHDCRDPYDFSPGGRMMYGTHEMMLRKKLEEQAELQHALELQERRLMNLQLLNLKNQQRQHNISLEFPVSPANAPSNQISQEITQEKSVVQIEEAVLLSEVADDGRSGSNGDVPKKEGSSLKCEQDDPFESLDDALPKNLFVSPTKFTDIPALSNLVDNASVPGTASLTFDDDSAQFAPSLSDTVHLKPSCPEMPSVSNGNGALEM